MEKVKKILVADDMSLSREILAKSLSKAGHRVIVAESGDEADMLIQGDDLDLLVLDNQMAPGPLGLELCAKYSDEIPVIMISSDDIEQAVCAAGAVAFFPRPILPDQLLTTINNL